MATERIIGVDFGTSTSVIRVKRYQDGRPVGDPLEVKQITFGKGNSMVPTLVQKRDSGETVFFGCDAEIPHRGTKTLGNFKVDLESGDADVRSQARALTREFFAYLAKTYKTQSEGGHLGESSDQERTIISYPVKWSDETKAFMLETAKAAGFSNVEGLDEAQAAIQAVTVQNANMLTRKGYFQAGVPVNILLIDMGAGTTDLVLCRHTPGTSPKTEILCTWPQKGTALFGGHEVDDLLKGIICDAVGEKVAGKISKEIFKGWKENMVSPALQRHEVVNEFSQLDDRADAMGMEIEYSVSRDSFEVAAADYLRTFPALVNGCLEEAKVSGDEVELVILTGGHSQWYFVQEMLRGEMPQLGRIQLSKVQQEPERIIPIALPQETVALGLVYGEMAVVRETQTLIHTEGKEPTCTEPGIMECWSTEEAPYLFFADEQGTKAVTMDDIILPALGHDFKWMTGSSHCTEFCSRCGAEGRRKRIVTPTASVPEKEQYTPAGAFIFGNIGDDYFIRAYTGRYTVVSIPPVVNGKRVVAIGREAFKGELLSGSKRLEKVIIPDTVTRIEPFAFNKCQKLTTVIAHPGIEFIGDNAFSMCRSLEIVDFGMSKPERGVVRFPSGIQTINANFGDAKITEVYLSKKTKIATGVLVKTFHLPRNKIHFYDED